MLVTQPTPGTLPLTLARLTGEFLDLANVLADTDPSDADALAQVHDLLDQSVTAIQGKAGSIAALIREFDARADAAQDEVRDCHRSHRGAEEPASGPDRRRSAHSRRFHPRCQIR